MPTVHDVQVLLQPASVPFRHGGSCSAPKRTIPAVCFCGEAPPEAPATIKLITAVTTTPRMSLW
jgi:hypothetical protein